MSTHVDDALLARFVAGDLGEHAAAHVALHLDACPACANRAREADPLARAFAAVDDPVVPEGLVAAALAEVEARGRATDERLLGLGLAAALAVTASMLSVLSTGPVGWAARLRALADLVIDGALGPWLALGTVGLLPVVALLALPADREAPALALERAA
ncbi:MAG: hypothetical protein H6732_15515 [Alphaproteobacteria bacterium]|nr:hypothetical protein [Alphaproteobacteria bacterium]